ncbi:DNA-directed RNA polymerase delta subunit [Candidatus Syntrophocurvum alkaliphilum]|uniref:DNA-directed RNA polymerase delta subunit n=1 Tax=Candidatus Syntrophocurvum alkaliphilum TaxID=2293317 RepID=A0A6I6DF54_9FIRM|nr:DNA-directed RNA polymerase subunit delta [Candidatus Syntrophocurvum alkaliphilum]QGU00696.1 DNA-directed RNA polymerase delta subunit [Candidatus Syntrophocurvum alkaliphilum]
MIISKKSEADWAVEILREKKEAMFYRDLILEITKKMERKVDDFTLTSIHTRLNLDNRLVYQGEGYWYYDNNKVR